MRVFPLSLFEFYFVGLLFLPAFRGLCAPDCGGVTAGGGATSARDSAAHCGATAACGGRAAASRGEIGGRGRRLLAAGLRLLLVGLRLLLVSLRLLSAGLLSQRTFLAGCSFVRAEAPALRLKILLRSLVPQICFVNLELKRQV